MLPVCTLKQERFHTSDHMERMRLELAFVVIALCCPNQAAVAQSAEKSESSQPIRQARFAQEAGATADVRSARGDHDVRGAWSASEVPDAGDKQVTQGGGVSRDRDKEAAEAGMHSSTAGVQPHTHGSAEKGTVAVPQIKYVGNSFSLKFHRPSCPFAKAMFDGNLVLFPFRHNAIESGYAPCRYCLPPHWKSVSGQVITKPACEKPDETPANRTDDDSVEAAGDSALITPSGERH